MQNVKQYCLTAAAIVVACMVADSGARAELIPLAYYRLGEDDAGASPGSVAVETIDSAEFDGVARNLVTTGGDNQPTYSDDTPVKSNFSSRSVVFDGVDDYFTGPAVPWHTLYDGFRVGMEAFVKIDELPEEGFVSVPFFDGGFDGGGGYGLVAGADGQWHAATPGQGGLQDPAGEIVLGKWQHIAFITGGNNFPFFLNGEVTADTISFYNSPGSETTIGASAGGASPFKGQIDEARVFRWTDDFDPMDLLFFQFEDVGDPGDVNGDGTTDLVDYEIIRDNYLTGVDRAEGNLDRRGVTDYDDFRIWKVAFEGGGVGAVPEPSSLLLLLAGASALPRRRRRAA